MSRQHLETSLRTAVGPFTSVPCIGDIPSESGDHPFLPLGKAPTY